MTTACIRNLVNKYVTKAKAMNPKLFTEPKYSPHSFRHSKAIHLVESGTQLIYIRDFLGHVSVKSTEVYARIGQSVISKMLTEHGKSAVQPSEPVEKIKNGKYPNFLEQSKHK